MTVQPRGYGEHGNLAAISGGTYGSAPWIRGTLATSHNRIRCNRFSPVDTGNTIGTLLTLPEDTVQPRGYGEHVSNAEFITNQTGSAPWIRGTRGNDLSVLSS